MSTYKDMTFCFSDCENKGCFRHKVNYEDMPKDALVSLCDFSESCERYKSINTKNGKVKNEN